MEKNQDLNKIKDDNFNINNKEKGDIIDVECKIKNSDVQINDNKDLSDDDNSKFYDRVMEIRKLASNKNYRKSLELMNVLYRDKEFPISEKIKLSGLYDMIHNILSFHERYKTNIEVIKKKYELNWAKNYLLTYVKENDYEIENIGINIQKVLESKIDSSFILEPEFNIKRMDIIDNGGTSLKLIDKLNYPFSQIHSNGIIYGKYQNINISSMFTEDNYDNLLDLYCKIEFPKVDWQVNNNSTVLIPNPKCDVFVSYNLVNKTTHKMITEILDQIANQRSDYFVPKYHNIIDPNLTVLPQIHHREGMIHQWTATEFHIEEIKLNKKYGKANISSPISNLNVSNYLEFYVGVETIFNAALPLISKLTKPRILLPGKLQTVIKSQRIYLEPGEEYSGLWHYDGKYEDIVGVVIYYYRCSDGLEGGELEFLDKTPAEELLWTDENFKKKEVEDYYQNVPRCKVKIKPGTLVVFSNYQLIHRVLRMAYPKDMLGDKQSPDGKASRDFLLYFIVDQSRELKSTSDLSTELVINNETDCTEKLELRKKLFEDQIKPAASFGVNNLVYSTGNGICLGVGFSDNESNLLSQNDYYHFNYKHIEGLNYIFAFNESPPLNRGLSWVFEIEEFPKQFDIDEY